MTPQEQEELDYQMGCATEQQNAYAVSCMDRKPDDTAKINDLVSQGRFVVVVEGPEYCRHTDALLPDARQLHCSNHATREEAMVALLKDVGDDPDPDLNYFILPRQPAAAYVPPTDEDIPF